MTSSWKEDWSNDSMKLRQETLKILMAKFPKYNKKVYECADEWVEKYVRADGVVAYYKAYFDK